MPIPSTIYTQPSCVTIDVAAGHDLAWLEIQSLTDGRLTNSGLEFLRRGLEPHVKTVLVEADYVCKDFRNLFSHFYSKKFRPRSSHCSRLHFFSKPGLTAVDIVVNSDSCRDAYIGYSVIEPVVENCIGRTVVDPRKLGRNKEEFFCLRSASQVRILGARFDALGFPYRSQSGEATVCAHSALWAACRYLSDRYPVYREIYPYDLIEMTGDTGGRRVPYRGMTYFDYSTILSTFGCHPAILHPRTNDPNGGQKVWSRDPETFYDLYAYMESGFPILTSFNFHVVNIIGHTISNAIRSDHVAKNGFYNSAAFLKEYIVVDDNYFPYQLLGYDGSNQFYDNNPYVGWPTPSIDNIFAAVVPLPEKAYLPPADARQFAYSFFNHVDIRRLIDAAITELGSTGEPLVARQLLTSSSAFKDRKCEFYKASPNDQLLGFPITLNLPHFIWVIELSAVNLFNNRKCFGEVVFDATIGPGEPEPIYARIGRDVIVLTSLQTEVATVPVAFPQYTHNLGRL